MHIFAKVKIFEYYVFPYSTYNNLDIMLNLLFIYTRARIEVYPREKWNISKF